VAGKKKNFPNEYEHGRLAIDVSQRRRTCCGVWVDDPAATPADLDALAGGGLNGRVAAASVRRRLLY